MSNRTMQDALLAEMLGEFRAAQTQQTDFWAKINGGLTNQTLSSGLHVIAAAGHWTESFTLPFGSLFIVNYSSVDMYVQNSGPSGSTAPTLGVGVTLVPSRSCRVINQAGIAYTVYGTSGDMVSVEVFSKPQPPVAQSIDLASASAAPVTVATSANPAAGAEISITVPTGETWILGSIKYTLVTSIAVATRLTSITYDDGTNVYMKLDAAVSQAAALTYNYDGMVDIGLSSALLGTDVYFPLPRLVLPAGHRIRTSTLGIDVADDYSAAVYYYWRYA